MDFQTGRSRGRGRKNVEQEEPEETGEKEEDKKEEKMETEQTGENGEQHESEKTNSNEKIENQDSEAVAEDKVYIYIYDATELFGWCFHISICEGL